MLTVCANQPHWVGDDLLKKHYCSYRFTTDTETRWSQLRSRKGLQVENVGLQTKAPLLYLWFRDGVFESGQPGKHLPLALASNGDPACYKEILDCLRRLSSLDCLKLSAEASALILKVLKSPNEAETWNRL